MDSDVENMIRFGEDSVCEFKSIRIPGKRVAEPEAKDIADEIAAAANATGAVLLFGVNDKTKEVEGIPEEKLDIAEAWLRNICNDSIKPAVIATIRKIAVRDSAGIERCVIRVDVPKSLFVHESPHGYFYRIGSSKRKMSPEMLARLFQQRSQTRLICFDEQVVADAEMEELIPALYSRLRTELSSADDGEFLRKLHLVAPDADGRMRPTVTGILVATERPEVHLPSAFIQAVCYRGIERNADYQLDARDITGPIDIQIKEACRFVERNMRIGAVKTPARVDIPQYAMSAVFEAVVNAVAHRDYSISGAKIRLHMFADRIELFSPGGLPNSLSLDEISSRQFARNELICTCLSRFPLPREFATSSRTRIIDRRGEGIPVIMSDTGKLSGMVPEYRLLGDSELMLTIPSAPIDDRDKLHQLVKGEMIHHKGDEKRVRDGINDGIKAIDDGIKVVGGGIMATVDGINDGINDGIKAKISVAVRNHPGIKVPELVLLVGKSKPTVERAVVQLKKEGIIEYHGSKKTGGYYVVERLR